MIGLLLLILSLFLFYTERFVPSVIIFFILLTNGFQLFPVQIMMAGIPLGKGSDLAMIYLILFVLGKIRDITAINRLYPVFKFALYIISFVIVDAIFSILFMKYSLVNVVQVFRPYLFLLSFVIFFSVPIRQLQIVFHIIALATVFQSLLFILQIVSGTPILLSQSGTSDIATGVLQGSGYTRFYNSPFFLFPALFYFLFVFRFKIALYQYLTLGILLMAVVGPAHRSGILSVVFAISIYALLKQSFTKRLVYISVLTSLFVVTSFVPVISDRIDEAFADVQTTLFSKLDLNSIDIQQNTSMFRIGHFLERYEYVVKQPLGWLFGIGLISDNSKEVTKLPFQIGLNSETTGGVVQVDTSDLIWSPLIVTLGIIGTLIYVLSFGKVLIFMYEEIEITKYAIMGFLVLLYAFIVSVTSIVLLEISFRTIIVLILTIICKVDYNKRIAFASNIDKK